MNRKFTKTLSFLLVTALCLSLSLNVFADSRSTTVSSSTMHHTIATSTTTNINRIDPTPIGSFWHNQGDPAGQRIVTSKEIKPEKVLATTQFPETFASHASSMGLVSVKKFNIDETFAVNVNSPSATFYVYIRWNGVSLRQQVITTYSGGSTTDYNRTIAYVPLQSTNISYLVTT